MTLKYYFVQTSNKTVQSEEELKIILKNILLWPSIFNIKKAWEGLTTSEPCHVPKKSWREESSLSYHQAYYEKLNLKMQQWGGGNLNCKFKTFFMFFTLQFQIWKVV